VNAELDALLLLQAEDDVVDGIAARLGEIAPRLEALDTARARAARQLEQTLTQLLAAEKKQRELVQRVQEHRQRQDRNEAQLDLVKRMKEATAALSQVESGRKLLQEGEHDLKEFTERLEGIRHAAEAQREALAEFESSQGERRDAIHRERAALEGELAAATATRDAIALRVPAAVRGTYQRIRARRRTQVVYPVTSGACGSCDTAVPVQRRKLMQARGTIEACEGCGVLLYATE